MLLSDYLEASQYKNLKIMRTYSELRRTPAQKKLKELCEELKNSCSELRRKLSKPIKLVAAAFLYIYDLNEAASS